MKKQKKAFGKFRKLVVAGTIAGLGTVVAASGCKAAHGRHCANDGSGVGERHCGNDTAYQDWLYTHGAAAGNRGGRAGR